MNQSQDRFLLIDTADRIALVGIYGGGRILAERRALSGPTSLTWLTRALSEIQSESGVAIASLAFIAGGVGPGGFTALRVGLSMAKAVSQSLNLPMVGVNRLEAAAVGAHLMAGRSGRFFVRFPAARDLEYIAGYRIEGDRMPVCERAPAAVSSTGALRIKIPKDATLVAVNPEGLYLGLPRLAALKAAAGETTDAIRLLPMYLRGATLGPGKKRFSLGNAVAREGGNR
ncbi:tRNA (adenosine(37)-N6)-threonylcarbamoyltransferase complex dimerization subunit type 1 TsaB [bacterium]|nr:tRNA (adenosine(37)-N6)-threonylcarbamoyltransferase complex dimerization subunit type 1 TsaB [bacterium]